MPEINIQQFSVEEYTWSDVRESVKKYEDELCQIIDKIDPGKPYPIVKATYPFGAKIFEKGKLYLSTKDKQEIVITDSRVPARLKQQLGYNSLPLGILLEHGTEVYSELEDRVFSLAYFKHGFNLGIWEFFAAASPFSVSAGARSLFMLPKITNADGHRRLAKYDVGFPAPQTPFAQHAIFKKIANHKNFSNPWTCEVLFLTQPWAQKIKEDSKWRDLHNFLLRRVWEHTHYSRNKMFIDTIWESFSRSLTKRRIKPDSHLIDTVKHLIFTAIGILPAFSPAIDNQAAPIDGLLKAYLDDYGLETYAPSMMQPHHFSLKIPDDYVYYSIQVPTYLESIPQFRVPTSTRSDLSALIDLMDMFVRELLHGEDVQHGDIYSIYEALQKIQFDCFHSEPNVDKGIYPSSDLPKEDKKLLYVPKGYATRAFCEKSSFARGCIRISKKC
jgi:hypothetical protein